MPNTKRQAKGVKQIDIPEGETFYSILTEQVAGMNSNIRKS